MKTWSVAIATALFVAPTLAMAADLPSRVEPPRYEPPVVAPPVFSWSGFYLGGNAGYAFDGRQRFAVSGNDALSNALLGAGIAPSYVATRARGFTGGGQIGYSYELGGRLGGGILGAGVEADAAYTRLRSEEFYNAGIGYADARTSVDFVGTVRGRLGLAIQNALIYGTGGFAYGGVRDSVTAVAPGFGGYASGTDRIRTGYAYGGGVEFAIPTTSFLNFVKSSAVTVKAEFIHYDLGSGSAVVGGTGALAGSSFNVRGRVDGNIARAGINYKFDMPGAAPSPVVARY